MDAKELRIGNLVEKGNELFEADFITIKMANNYNPIPLTEEWLLKFGFDKREDGDFNLFKHSEVDIIIDKDFSSWMCDGINFSVNNIRYVHKLQNLYFALMGEEL